MQIFKFEEEFGLEDSIDVLFSCVSFEDRCEALCRYIKKPGSIKKIYLFRNTDICSKKSGKKNNECNLAVNKKQNDIILHLEKIGVNYKVIESMHRQINRKIEAITGLVNYVTADLGFLERAPVVGIDITCFTRIDLIILLDYLFEFIPDVKVKTIYIPPEEYMPSPLSDEERWLTRGYSGIDSIFGFCGEYDYLKDDMLVVLSGFEKERPQSFIDAYESEIILFGSSAEHPVNPAFGKIAFEIQQSFLASNINISPFYFTADSIKDCLADLESKLEAHLQKYNLVIAPLCTKPSVVATFLLAKKYPQIQLSYCYPQEYNWKNYSKGMDGRIFIEDVIDSKVI